MQALTPTDRDYWKHIVQANNSFGVEMLKVIALARPLDNIFVSPTSIFLILSMLYNGAAGETAQQICNALKLPRPQEINPWNRQLLNHLCAAGFGHDLFVASALWFGKGILCHDQFVNNCIEGYSASLYGLEFTSPDALSQVNYWVANATSNKIEHVINGVDPDAELIVTNAVYFFALWKDQFNKDNTKLEPFNLVGGGTKEVHMMSRTGQYEYFESEAFQVVKLPYLQSPFFMQIILPRPGFHFGHCLSAVSQPGMPMIPCDLELKMPRFGLEFDVDLVGHLPRLGITNLSDFSLICPNLKLSGLVHKCKLTVDEEGTEAGAGAVSSGGFGSPLKMHIDRPFLLNIVDGGSNQILFSGAVVSPEL